MPKIKGFGVNDKFKVFPCSVGPVQGIVPFKDNIPPYGAFANTNKIEHDNQGKCKGIYEVPQSKTLDGTPLYIYNKPATITWPSSENAFHAQKIIAYKKDLYGKNPNDPKIKILDDMLMELSQLPTPPDTEFLPRTHWDGLVKKNLSALGLNDKSQFDALCNAHYHPSKKNNDGINPQTGLPVTYDYMKFALKMKLEKHPELKAMAKEFARRGIMPMEISQHDQTWSSFKDGEGRNLLGIAILELGNEFLEKEDNVPKTMLPIQNPHTAYQGMQAKMPNTFGYNQLRPYVNNNNGKAFQDLTSLIGPTGNAPVSKPVAVNPPPSPPPQKKPKSIAPQQQGVLPINPTHQQVQAVKPTAPQAPPSYTHSYTPQLKQYQTSTKTSQANLSPTERILSAIKNNSNPSINALAISLIPDAGRPGMNMVCVKFANPQAVAEFRQQYSDYIDRNGKLHSAPSGSGPNEILLGEGRATKVFEKLGIPKHGLSNPHPMLNALKWDLLASYRIMETTGAIGVSLVDDDKRPGMKMVRLEFKDTQAADVFNGRYATFKSNTPGMLDPAPRDPHRSNVILLGEFRAQNVFGAKGTLPIPKMGDGTEVLAALKEELQPKQSPKFKTKS